MYKFFFNDGTTAPASFLGSICYLLGIDYPFAHKRIIDAGLYHKLHGMPDIHKGWFFFMSPYQAFLDMFKDMTDTFKPYKDYKDNRQKWRDFGQPLIGAIHIVLGLINLTASLIIFLVTASLLIFGLVVSLPVLLPVLVASLIIFYAFDKNLGQDIFDGMIIAPFYGMLFLGIATSWIANAITELIRGTTQLVTTPLTWFIKMPLRWYMTEKNGIPNAEDKDKIRDTTHWVMSRLKVDGGGIPFDELNTILTGLHRMIEDATIWKKQKTMISNENIKYANFYNHYQNKNNDSSFEEQKFYACEYLKLFTSPISPILKKFLTFSLWEKHLREQGKSIFPKDVVNCIGTFFISESRNYVKSYEEYTEKKETTYDAYRIHRRRQ